MDSSSQRWQRQAISGDSRWWSVRSNDSLCSSWLTHDRGVSLRGFARDLHPQGLSLPFVVSMVLWHVLLRKQHSRVVQRTQFRLCRYCQVYLAICAVVPDRVTCVLWLCWCCCEPVCTNSSHCVPQQSSGSEGRLYLSCLLHSIGSLPTTVFQPNAPRLFQAS